MGSLGLVTLFWLVLLRFASFWVSLDLLVTRLGLFWLVSDCSGLFGPHFGSFCLVLGRFGLFDVVLVNMCLILVIVGSVKFSLLVVLAHFVSF